MPLRSAAANFFLSLSQGRAASAAGLGGGTKSGFFPEEQSRRLQVSVLPMRSEDVIKGIERADKELGVGLWRLDHPRISY